MEEKIEQSVDLQRGEVERLSKLLAEKDAENKNLKNSIKEIGNKYEKQIEEMEKEFESKMPGRLVDTVSMIVKDYERSALDEITIFDNAFDDDEIEMIKKLADQIPASKGTVGTSEVDTRMRNSTVKWFDRHDPKYSFLYGKICQLFINANKKYKFNLTGFFENIQYTIYDGRDEPSYYHFHSDTGKVASQRKLSISIQLSDEKEYEGGELQFQLVKEPFSVTKKKGTAVVFPSFIQHRVLAVTKGIRTSLVCWFAGPPFR